MRRDVLPDELLQEIAGSGAGHGEPGIRKGKADAVAVLGRIVEVRDRAGGQMAEDA